MSEQDFGESSLVEHLVELRGRLVRALLGLGVVLLALLPFTQKLYNALAEPLVGRSRIWPILDFTTYWLPRYLLMVLALAGDSTMTSDLPMDRSIPESEDEKRVWCQTRHRYI